MPLGAFRLNTLAKYMPVAAAGRSWDLYNGGGDSSEFELTTTDTDGMTSCVVDGRLLIAYMVNSANTTMNLKLFTIGSTPGSYSMSNTATDNFTAPSSIGSRSIKMVRFDTDKILLCYGASSNWYGRVITTSSGNITIGSENTISTGDELLGAANGNNLIAMTSTKILMQGGTGNPGKKISLYTISGNTVTLEDSWVPSVSYNPGWWVSKIDSTTALVCWPINYAGGSTTESISASVISISSGTSITTVSTSEHVVRSSTDDYYNWGKTNYWTENLVDDGVVMATSRQLNASRASQTKFFPGATVISATSGGTITGEGVGDSVALELDPIKDTSGDYTLSSPVPSTENSISCNVRSGYYLCMFRMMNNNSSNLDQAYYELHVIKNDNGNAINPTDPAYSPVAIYSKPYNYYLFGFDQFYLHRVDDDTAIATFAKGRNATTAPNGRVACKIIKAPVRAGANVTAQGNAQVDTAQSKFGSASALFDGSGDGLLVTNVSDLGVGTGDISVECYVRVTTTTPGAQTIYDQRDDANGFWPALFINNDGSLVRFGFWWDGAYRLYHQTTPNINTWYHVALVRQNGDWAIYVDGVKSSSTYTGADFIVANDDASIGFNFNASNSINGHIDEVRVSNIARYTSNFTAPTAPFVNDSNTLLLLHMDGTDGSTVFTDDNS